MLGSSSAKDTTSPTRPSARTESIIPATTLAMTENSVQYQYSERAARPSNPTYLPKHDVTAWLKFIV